MSSPLLLHDQSSLRSSKQGRALNLFIFYDNDARLLAPKPVHDGLCAGVMYPSKTKFLLKNARK